MVKSSIWPIDKTGTTTLSQSGLGSNGNEEILYFPEISRTEASSSDGLIYSTLIGRFLPCRNAVSIFYSFIWQG